MKKIAICWLGVGNYNILFDEFYRSFNERFCTDLDRTFFIFTDKPELYQTVQNGIVYGISNACLHKGYTLFRKFNYFLMAENKFLEYDYVCVVNGNMVCKEIVNSIDVIDEYKPISVITHPCNLWIRKGTYICNPDSMASFTPDSDWQYKQSGFSISTTVEFLKLANSIEGWRHLDKVSGGDRFVPWHDETYANKYYYLNRDKLNVLDGKIYAFPMGFAGLEQYYDSCRIYTVNKPRKFHDSKVQFVQSTPPDLYTLQYGKEIHQ